MRSWCEYGSDTFNTPIVSKVYLQYFVHLQPRIILIIMAWHVVFLFFKTQYLSGRFLRITEKLF